MIGKQLKMETYRALQEYLSHSARQRPLCPAYGVDVVWNGTRCILFLQLDRHCKVYALYAVWGADAERPELITENLILSALMELVIFRCAA